MNLQAKIFSEGLAINLSVLQKKKHETFTANASSYWNKAGMIYGR